MASVRNNHEISVLTRQKLTSLAESPVDGSEEGGGHSTAQLFRVFKISPAVVERTGGVMFVDFMGQAWGICHFC